MYQLSPNIELLFTEAGPDLADRIRAAAAAGFDAVEMWGTSDKDVAALAKALADTGVSLTSLLALGLAATAAVFTLLDAVVLSPLPYPHAERLVSLSSPMPKRCLLIQP